MRLIVEHEHFRQVILENSHLKLITVDDTHTLSESIEEAAVTLTNNKLHIIGLASGKLFHWYGAVELTKKEIEFENGRPLELKGLQTVADSSGKVHLFYLTKNSRKNIYALTHQTFVHEWTEPLVAGTNHTSQVSDYKVGCGREGLMYLVYCARSNNNLYYQVFEETSFAWSGSVPLARSNCSNPVILATDILHVSWIEKNDIFKVRYCSLKEKWSAIETLIESRLPITKLGLVILDNKLEVSWLIGQSVYIKQFKDEWLEIMQYQLAQVTEVTKIYQNHDNSALIINYYQVQQDPEENRPEEQEEQSEPSTDDFRSVASGDRQDVTSQKPSENNKQNEIQQKFIEEAFYLREKCENLQQEYVNVADQLENIKNEFMQQGNESLVHDMQNIKARLQTINERVETVSDSWRHWKTRPQIPALDQVRQDLDKHIQLEKQNRSNVEATLLNINRQFSTLNSKIDNLKKNVDDLEKNIKLNKRRGLLQRIFRR